MRYLVVSKNEIKLKRISIILLLTTITYSAAYAQETDSRRMTTGTFLQVSNIEEVGPPRVFDGFVVFTYEQPGFVRYVAAAFEHEGFKERHVFTARKREDQPDLFYLVYPVDTATAEIGQLDYRLIVDGVWLTDPHAPTVRQERNGVTVGSVALRSPPPYEKTSPIINSVGTVTFLFALNRRVSPTLETVDTRRIAISSLQQPRVSIVGTFNGWDPYMHRLSGPDEDGFYTITLPIPPGPHYYYYMVDGQRVLDPFNHTRARDLQTGTFVSHIVLDR